MHTRINLSSIKNLIEIKKIDNSTLIVKSLI